MRGSAVGRRKWTFAGSHAGGRRAAAIYTLLATQKLVGHEARACIADVVARINGHPAKQLDDLLPWNWKEAQAIAA